MTAPVSLRNIPQNNIFRKGDVFVLFGELFGRGYANGLVNEARKAGMTIVGITVGRRDENNALRALTDEELATAEANLGGRIINVPLMAGFDLDAPAGNPPDRSAGQHDAQELAGRQARLETHRKMPRSRRKALQGFRRRGDGSARWHDPGRQQCFFAHDGGRHPQGEGVHGDCQPYLQGRGDRFMSSRALLDSDLGKLCLMNFDEVTANTFST